METRGRALVTGAAGFIGSHLAECLRFDGWKVTGVDSFSDYYEPRLKKENLAGLEEADDFRLLALDLATDGLEHVLDGVDVVFHLAGQPGVRSSWTEFDSYLRHNVEATQRLLEACRDITSLNRFVVASSSSIYGEVGKYPVREDVTPHPISPYGVSKLAAEHICGVYAPQFWRPHDCPPLFHRVWTETEAGQWR